MTDERYLSARAAAAQLGVNVATIYAYVSRGLIHSEAADAARRERRYLAADVRRLVAQRTYRRDPAQAASDAMHWGAPVLESGLTLIADGQLYYRGVAATDLARSARFEAVAALLWTGDRAKWAALFAGAGAVALPRLPAEFALVERAQAALALAGPQDVAALDLSRAAETGARIIALLTAALGGAGVDGGSSRISLVAITSEMLGRGWGVAPADHDLLDAALILCADHELNASSFAARVAASAGANPYLAVTAGLATLQGFRHGGMTSQVADLWRDAATTGATAAIAARLQRGQPVPGFGHQLYPDGDPRGALLLDLIRQRRPEAPTTAQMDALVAAAGTLLRRAPTIDLALVALANALALPDGAALALFALGRTAGWVAHAIEQYAAGTLIRPRATYRGRLPGASESSTLQPLE